ncbi:MAG: alpha/beta hydrolase-fold protein [Bacteroidota bacterium]
MKTTMFLLLAMAVSLDTVVAQETPKSNDIPKAERSSLALPKIQVIPIKDTKNDRQYELYVKLPEDYAENSDKKYPVIYYTDAMWHVELLSGATEYIMEEAILVGISWEKDLTSDVGPHVSRYRDYSMRASSNPEHQKKYQFGQADDHLAFLRNDVIPYVEDNYSTDAERRTYFGYSLSGEFGVYILLTQPDTFKNYILGSPSLKGEIPHVAELESASRHKDLNANVFVSYGTLEKESGEHIDEFVALLKSRNDQHVTLQYEIIDGSHQTAFPMTVVRSIAWLSKINDFYVNRLENAWGDAIQLESTINDDLVLFPNQAENGSLYYFNLSKGKMYYAPNKNDAFPEVQEADIDFGHHAFISPSQDYLLVTARNKEDANRKDNDIYVYFKRKNGTWTQPVNLGNSVNNDFNEKTPCITPDGKYLFFGRDKRNIEPGLSNIYWVNTEVIYKVSPPIYKSVKPKTRHLNL